MNIEDERKAFEAAIDTRKLYVTKLAKWNGERYAFTAEAWTHKPLVQVLFEVWQAAKADAKPVCPTCGTHEVSLEKTCHNSDCNAYAEPVTVYEGWKE